MQQKSGNRKQQKGRTQRLHGKLLEQTVGSWMRIHKFLCCLCSTTEDWVKKNAHTDAEYVFAGLGTEAHKIQYMSDHNCHIGLNVCNWLQISSLTKIFFLQLISCFHTGFSVLPRRHHLCLRVIIFVVLKYHTSTSLFLISSGCHSLVLTLFSFQYARGKVVVLLPPFKSLQLQLFIQSLRYACFVACHFLWLLLHQEFLVLNYIMTVVL